MSRRKRALLWAGLLVVLTVVGVIGVWWLTTPTPGVTRANFERLHAGMTRNDVMAIMGKPADHELYGTASVTYQWSIEEGIVQIVEGQMVKDEETFAKLKEGSLPNNIDGAFLVEKYTKEQVDKQRTSITAAIMAWREHNRSRKQRLPLAPAPAKETWLTRIRNWMGL
jgi:hypothetical protein